MNHADELRRFLRDDPVLWRALEEARTFALPHWWIVSGAVYNTVWNTLTGKPPGFGIKDIDLFYFDPDAGWEAEDRVIQRAAGHFSPDPPVEIRNQARVHLWYHEHFGHPVAPSHNTLEGLENFACETHAVGVRLGEDGSLDIHAPFGLDAIFEMRVVPNTRGLNRATHEAKAERCKALWPEVTVEPWPEIAIIRGGAHHDCATLLDLIHRAFAFMEGRIDPPSSLHRLDAARLATKAAEEICLLAHDGRAITGCVFCDPRPDVLYIGKLAVEPSLQGRGIGRTLIEAAEAEARARGLAVLELQTRIELAENYHAFVKMGFAKTGETAHPGFDRPTSITMRKRL